MPDAPAPPSASEPTPPALTPPDLRGVFFLVGPTAVGKSELALALAEAFGAEIVGADAFQVYEGLGQLTAQPPPEALTRVRHHLVGCVPLCENFDAGRYLRQAHAALADIRRRGKPALVAGGTGLYLRALTRGLAELPPMNPELRAELTTWPLERLVERLAELDPQAATSIDRHNPRRVQRALEVCLVSGKPFSSFLGQWEQTGNPRPRLHGARLERERGELYQRIDQRTAELFQTDTMLDEVARALEADPSPTARQAIGWKEAVSVLQGGLSREEAASAVAQATRRYAKRQLTWLRREPDWVPVMLSGRPFEENWEILKELARAAWESEAP